MKKLLLSLSLLTLSFVQAQNIFSFGFDGTTADMLTAGWQQVNLSNPAGTALWGIPSTTPTSTFSGGGQAGGATSFGLVNYTSVAASSAGTISNWLISPVINVQNGDIVTFYTRLGRNVATGGSATYADNLQLTMSKMGASSVIPSVDENDLGDFTTLCNEINPNLDLTTYPITWTQFSYTVSGLTGATDCMFAFRYYVTDGGPTGNNSDIIGIDTFSVDRQVASTDSFFKNSLSVSPNPAKDFINITSIDNSVINSAVITDINGRTVKQVSMKGDTNSQINISELNSGIYFLKVSTDQGVGTTKVIKN